MSNNKLLVFLFLCAGALSAQQIVGGGGGGGGIPTTGLIPCAVIATTSTINLNGAACNGTGAAAWQFAVGPLTGTSTITLTNLIEGPFEADITNGASAQTLNLPGAWTGACAIPPDAAAVVVLRGMWNGTAMLYPTCSVSGVGYTAIQNVCGAATPGTGFARNGIDNTGLGYADVDSNGACHQTPIVVAGKMPTFDNSIIFAGTDATTQTTPTVSSTLNGTVVTGSFTESKSCTTSSAASIKFSSTVTIPANSIAALADHLTVLVTYLTTTPAANNADLGMDLLMDGNNLFTFDAVPNNSMLSLAAFPMSTTYDVFPTVVAAGANSTVTAAWTSGISGTQIPGQRSYNGTAAVGSVNLGVTHTIGVQMECTAATGTNTIELLGIKVIKQ